MSTQLAASTSQQTEHIESMLKKFTDASIVDVTSFSDLSRDESINIQKLRLSIVGIEDWPRGRLVRWLHAFNNDLSQTADAITNHVVFRQAWGLDDLRRPNEWQGSEVLSRYCAYGFTGPDKEGSPVLISPLGRLDVAGIMKSTEASQFLRYSLMVMERGLQRCEERAEQTGRVYERMIMIMDLEGMTSDHYLCKPFAATYLTLISLFQENYPNLLKKILVINANSMVRYTYSIVTPFLSATTQSLIDMTADDCRSIIQRYIPVANLPKEFGGTQNEEEKEFIGHHLQYYSEADSQSSASSNDSQEEDQFIDKIPARYFKDGRIGRETFANEITIHAGHKQIIDIDIRESGSRICWRFCCLQEDVGFAIYYDYRKTFADQTRDMQPIFPHIRFECNEVPETGNIMIDQPGRYILVFDNSYSWFWAKEIRYTVEVIEPQLADLEQF